MDQAIRWRNITLSAVLCFGLAVGLGRAQSASSGQASRPGDLRITVIGCVERSATPRGTSGGSAPASAVGQTKYVLSNITMSGRNDRSSGAPADLMTETANSYRLDDKQNELIAPHVGNRVEVTGTIVNGGQPPVGTTGPTTPGTVVSTAAPLLRVESLRTISSDSPECSR